MQPKLGSTSELHTCWRPWRLLGEEIFYIVCWNNRLLKVQFYIYVCVCVWFRTNCCYPTNGTFVFPWSARLGMSGACCSLLLFYCIHFCLYIPVFLQMVVAVCRWYAVVFCGLGSWFCWMTFISALFSVFAVILTIQVPKKLYLCFCVLDRVEDESVMVSDVSVELNSQSAITVTSFWFESKSQPTYMHCLPSCPQSDVTHSGMKWVTATVCYTCQHVGWRDWPVTQNSRYWHHKICNISCLNSHFLSQFMLKWNLYQHICLSALFAIGVS